MAKLLISYDNRDMCIEKYTKMLDHANDKLQIYTEAYNNQKDIDNKTHEKWANLPWYKRIWKREPGKWYWRDYINIDPLYWKLQLIQDRIIRIKKILKMLSEMHKGDYIELHSTQEN